MCTNDRTLESSSSVVANLPVGIASSATLIARLHTLNAEKKALQPLIQVARNEEIEQKRMRADFNRFQKDSAAECIELNNKIQGLQQYTAELEHAVPCTLR